MKKGFFADTYLFGFLVLISFLVYIALSSVTSDLSDEIATKYADDPDVNASFFMENSKESVNATGGSFIVVLAFGAVIALFLASQIEFRLIDFFASLILNPIFIFIAIFLVAIGKYFLSFSMFSGQVTNHSGLVAFFTGIEFPIVLLLFSGILLSIMFLKR